MKQRLLKGLLLLFLLVSMVACSSENPESEETGGNATEIHLTTQIDGTFKGHVGEGKVSIEHEGEIVDYLITGDVVGDIDKVKNGDEIAFSFVLDRQGQSVLETLRLN